MICLDKSEGIRVSFTHKEIIMSVTALTLSQFLKEVLDSDLTGEEVFAVAHRCYGIDKRSFGKLWNELLCKQHGI